MRHVMLVQRALLAAALIATVPAHAVLKSPFLTSAG